VSRQIVASLALAVLVAFAGCGGTDGCRKGTYRVTVDYSAVPAADQLRVTAVVEDGRTLTGTFDKPGGNRGTVEIDFGSAYRAGVSVTVTIEALAGGVTVGSATEPVTAPAGCDAFSITLVANGDGDGGVSTGDVAITPGAPSVKAGAKLTFMAAEPVDWSVSEGDSGGTIGSTGVYTAPTKTGSYHVIATSRADAKKKGSATVTVVPWVLDVVAGRPGGVGTADGVGPDARFTGPTGGLTFANGSLYMADGLNTIRKIDLTTKAVTTIAGFPDYNGGSMDGVGVDARFKSSWGMAVYKNFLYVADNATLIRRIDLTTRDVRTIAGAVNQTGTTDSQYGIGARFNGAQGMVSDGAGHLLMADSYGNSVRAVDLTGPNESQPTWSTTTFKNSGLSFLNPMGLAWDGTSLYVTTSQYIGSTFTQALQKVTFTTAPGPWTAPNNGAPSGATVQITGSGGTTVSGTFISAVAVYQGNVYYSYGNGDGRVNVVTPGSSGPSLVAGGAPNQADGSSSGAGFSNRFNLVSDGAGKLYMGDGCCVRQITIAGGTVSTPFGALPSFASTDGMAALASFARPAGVAYDGADTAWVLDGNGSKSTLRQVTISTGAVTTISTSAALSYVSDLTYDGKGHLYLGTSDADGVSWGLVSIATADGTVTTVVPPVGGQRTDALVADDSGHVYGTRFNTVIKIDTTATPVTTTIVAGTSKMSGTTDSPALFGHAQAIAWDGADTLWVADDAAIRSVAISSGAVVTVAGVPGTKGTSDGTGNSARFLGPNALAADGSIVYIVDGSQIRRLDATTGAVTQWAGVAYSAGVQLGPLPAMVNAPRALVSMGGGSLLFVDEYALARIH
jgi:hypothetical protein